MDASEEEARLDAAIKRSHDLDQIMLATISYVERHHPYMTPAMAQGVCRGIRATLEGLSPEEAPTAALEPFQIRADRIIEAVWGGPHHCNKITKTKTTYQDGTMWEVKAYGELATFDYDRLTRLVVAAHDNCIRATVVGGWSGGIKVRLWERFGRTGEIYERHPTMEEALAKVRLR